MKNPRWVRLDASTTNRMSATLELTSTVCRPSAPQSRKCVVGGAGDDDDDDDDGQYHDVELDADDIWT